jgi:hypothetical protein
MLPRVMCSSYKVAATMAVTLTVSQIAVTLCRRLSSDTYTLSAYTTEMRCSAPQLNLWDAVRQQDQAAIATILTTAQGKKQLSGA